jgi:hypothetical protein
MFERQKVFTYATGARHFFPIGTKKQFKKWEIYKFLLVS